MHNLLKSEILLQNKNINKIFKTNICKKLMSDETRKFWLLRFVFTPYVQHEQGKVIMLVSKLNCILLIHLFKHSR